MTHDPRRPSRGTVPLPPDLDPTDERTRREKAALADLDARLAIGELTPEDADLELLELALERVSYLPPEIVEELRQLGREVLDEPEMVETRALAPRPSGAHER